MTIVYVTVGKRMVYLSEMTQLLWGKWRDDTHYHPLVCHMVDVAQVARRMWTDIISRAAREAIAQAFGMSKTSVEPLVALIAALHDLGKASPAFQLHPSLNATTRARVRALLAKTGLRCPPQPEFIPHGEITAAELPRILQEQLGFDVHAASRLATAIGGHHGIFPRSDQILKCDSKDVVGGSQWRLVRLELVKVLANLLGATTAHQGVSLDNSTAMTIAGLVCVADWIGSAEEFFPYETTPSASLDLVAYARGSADRAREALDKLRWRELALKSVSCAFEDLFPFPPNDLQRTVVELASRIDKPTLVVVEAPMGEGKTEAAMFLADSLAMSLGQRGYYFALPTQATSNQMFSRVRGFLGRRYTEMEVNLQLLHGHVALSAEFQTMRKETDLAPVCVFDPDQSQNEARAGLHPENSAKMR